MFMFHFLERNLCYFTQKSFLVGGGSGCNTIIKSAPGPNLWDLRWRCYCEGVYMTWTWPEHDLDMVWTQAWQSFEKKLNVNVHVIPQFPPLYTDCSIIHNVAMFWWVKYIKNLAAGKVNILAPLSAMSDILDPLMAESNILTRWWRR